MKLQTVSWKQGSHQKKGMGKQHHHGRGSFSSCTHVLTSFLPRSKGLQPPHSPQRNCLQGKIKSCQQSPVQVHICCEKIVLTWPLVKIFHLLRLSPITRGSHGCFHFNISILTTIGREGTEDSTTFQVRGSCILIFQDTAARWLKYAHLHRQSMTQWSSRFLNMLWHLQLHRG